MLHPVCRTQPQKEQMDTGCGDRDVKRMKRLLKNRESAQASRERKKAYVETLERQIQTADSSLNEAQSELLNVHREIVRLHQTLLRTQQFLPPNNLSVSIDRNFSTATHALLTTIVAPALDGASAFQLTHRDFPLLAIHGRESTALSDLRYRSTTPYAASDISSVVATIIVPQPARSATGAAAATNVAPLSTTAMMVYPVTVSDWHVGPDGEQLAYDAAALLIVTAPSAIASAGASATALIAASGALLDTPVPPAAPVAPTRAPEALPPAIRGWMDDATGPAAVARRALRTIAEAKGVGIGGATACISMSAAAAGAAGAPAGRGHHHHHHHHAAAPHGHHHHHHGHHHHHHHHHASLAGGGHPEFVLPGLPAPCPTLAQRGRSRSAPSARSSALVRGEALAAAEAADAAAAAVAAAAAAAAAMESLVTDAGAYGALSLVADGHGSAPSPVLSGRRVLRSISASTLNAAGGAAADPQAKDGIATVDRGEVDGDDDVASPAPYALPSYGICSPSMATATSTPSPLHSPPSARAAVLHSAALPAAPLSAALCGLPAGAVHRAAPGGPPAVPSWSPLRAAPRGADVAATAAAAAVGAVCDTPSPAVAAAARGTAAAVRSGPPPRGGRAAGGSVPPGDVDAVVPVVVVPTDVVLGPQAAVLGALGLGSGVSAILASALSQPHCAVLVVGGDTGPRIVA